MSEHERHILAKLVRKLANEKYGRNAKHMPDRESEYQLLMKLAKDLEAEAK